MMNTQLNKTIEKIKSRAQETTFNTNALKVSIKNAKLDNVFRETRLNYIFEEKDDLTQEKVYIFIPKGEYCNLTLKGALTLDLNLSPMQADPDMGVAEGEAKDLLEKSNAFLIFQADPKPLTQHEILYKTRTGLLQRGFTPEKPKAVERTEDEMEDSRRTPSELKYVKRKREMDELFRRGDFGGN